MESISHTKGSDLGRALAIVNGAAARCKEMEGRKKERRKKKKGRGCPILPRCRTMLVGATP
jgi:hypothetical protein